MRRLGLVVLLLAGCAEMNTRATGGRTLPRGISAWTYDYDEVRVAQIKAHNAAAPEHARFRYLFPYAGSISFGKDRTFTTSWSPDGPAKYAAALGPGILLLPIFDGRQDGKEFNGWSATEYEAAAGNVAALILTDPHAAGVQIDIEPFHPDHLPFYEALGAKLRAGGKLMTGFIGASKPDEVLRRMYAACDIMVLSGYDYELPTPDQYGAALERHLQICHRFAKAAGTLTLVGIPAAGSWAEHEYTGVVEDGRLVRKETGFTQPQWLGAAVRAVAAHESDSTHLGVALWVLTGRTHRDPGETLKSYQPDFIREECWALLRTLGR